jgi:hypothetical protein
MKILTLTLSALLLSLSAQAADCVDGNGNDISRNPVAIIERIAAESYCFDAVEFAIACSYGTSIDEHIAGAAKRVCRSQLEQSKPSRENLELLSRMENACAEIWLKKEGTMYVSINAFCELRAVEWMTTLNAEND